MLTTNYNSFSLRSKKRNTTQVINASIINQLIRCASDRQETRKQNGEEKSNTFQSLINSPHKLSSSLETFFFNILIIFKLEKRTKPE